MFPLLVLSCSSVHCTVLHHSCLFLCFLLLLYFLFYSTDRLFNYCLCSPQNPHRINSVFTLSVSRALTLRPFVPRIPCVPPLLRSYLHSHSVSLHLTLSCQDSVLTQGIRGIGWEWYLYIPRTYYFGIWLGQAYSPHLGVC